MRIFKKPMALMLSLLLLLALVPTVVYAEEAIEIKNISGSCYTYENSTFTELKDDAGFYNAFTNETYGIVDRSEMTNGKVTVHRPTDTLEANGDFYVCYGVVFKGSNRKISESATGEDIIKFEDNGNVITHTFTEGDQENTGNNKNRIVISLIYKKVEQVVVTYDFSGPEGVTKVYPVIAKYELNDRYGPWEAPYSLSYFTVPQDESYLNLIKQEGDDPKFYTYGYFTDKTLDETAEANKVDLSNLTVSVMQGESVALPHLAQHRNLSMDPYTQATTNEVFYPVVSFVAIGNDGKYYEFNGWKVDGQEDVAVDTLYGEYTPSAATTLKADWKELPTLTAADPSTIPDVPLLKTYSINGDSNTYGVQLSQKTTEYFTTETVITGVDRLITYDVKLQFSDLFSSSDMPWGRGSAYFKTVDNASFADLDVDVKLDDHLVPAADEDGYTTITIRSASLKITGIEIDEVALTSDKANGTKNEDGSYTINAKLEGAKEFTIDFDWDEYSSGEMSIEIPTKAVDGFTGEINGTGVTVTGHMDFTQAHDASKGTETDKADFTADEFIRYLLAYDETWFNKYGGENMTLTDMLQAAKDVQAKLSSFTIGSNALKATVSANLEDLALDQTEVSLHVNGTATVTPVFTPDTVANKAVTWSVEAGKEDIVSVDNGVITGLKTGAATVTCTSDYDGTKTASVTVTVNGVVYVEPSTGGTVSITGDNADAITGTDNAYSVSGEVTVTVTPNSGSSMAGEKPSVYYYDEDGTKHSLSSEQITSNGDGTFTFSMPDGVSTVYVSAAFVIENATGKTVIGDSVTVVSSETSTQYDSHANKLEIEMTPAAQEEMLRRVAQEGSGTKYNETALQTTLAAAGVTASGEIYRHIQTRANIQVTSYEETGLNTGKLELDIEYQFRVVASTTADPDAVRLDGGSGTQNAVVMEPGDTEGWTEYESTEATYIVVPVTNLMGKPGEWIRATHTHTDSNGVEKIYTQYLKVANDNTVTYVNLHEGNSPFTFEGVPGVKDIKLDNAGSPVDMNIAFTPGEDAYTATVGSDVERLTLNVDTAGTASLVNNITVELNGETLISGNATSAQYELNLIDNSVNRVEITCSVSGVTQTYTINITRGTTYTPPAPSTYSTTVTEPEHGAVTASPAYAETGGKVTLTVKPDEGYVLDTLTVTDRSGKAVAVTDNGDGTYTFTMPSGGVTVKAAFKLKTCDGGADCPSRRFTDLDVKAWYHPYTDYVITQGLMHGKAPTSFVPDGIVTRAEMVTVLWNMSGTPVVNYLMTYTDVSEEAWYAEAIRWASSEGIVDGYGNNAFGPDDPITREQMATMLYRYEKELGGGGFTGAWMFQSAFTDAAKVNDWAREAVAWCGMNGILEGRGDGSFDPAGKAQRSELAKVLTKYRQISGE